MEGYKGNLPRFSKITDKRGGKSGEYNKTGWKYTEKLLESQRLNGGKFHSVVIEIGDKPLYSKRTVKKALEIIEKIVGKYPAYWKIERNDQLYNNIHIHIIILAPENTKFHKRYNNFPTYSELLGSRPEYQDKTMYENLRDFMFYLMKPADGRASFKVPAHVTQMYLEWWEEKLKQGEGNPTWESPQLRGALNMDISWLKDLDREEMQARYEPALEDSPISTLWESKPPQNESSTSSQLAPTQPLSFYKPKIPYIPDYTTQHLVQIPLHFLPFNPTPLANYPPK